MPPTATTDAGFTFVPEPPIAIPVHFPFPLPNPLGPLTDLVGSWHGSGFNTIWRPHFPATHDRFLELNLTTESVTFSAISGQIPNRGLGQQDMNMFGITYMDNIQDAQTGAGLHIEPGIWAVVPATTDPKVQATVVRMASIPHGTVILAQGTATTAPGAPTIPGANLIPFGTGGTAPKNTDGNFASELNGAKGTFSELVLGTPTTFRQPAGNPPAGFTQAMVDDPNSVLRAALTGETVRSTTTLRVTTTSTPTPGGGTANTAFLGPNADTARVDATFWIESIESPGRPDILQLQYSQTVMLNFNGLSWPHVTVGTLRKQLVVTVPPILIDPSLAQLKPVDTVVPHPIPTPDPAPQVG